MTFIKYGHRYISCNMHFIGRTCYYRGCCRLYDENGQNTEKKFVKNYFLYKTLKNCTLNLINIYSYHIKVLKLIDID